MTILPKATMLLMTYNQSKYIEQSLKSCLAQNYLNLEIIISDDNSTDDTFEKIKQTLKKYKGKHSIIVNQNKKNLGIGRHFAKLMDSYASGEIVVMCAGDDISKPSRVSRTVEEWLRNEKPSLIAHSLEEIDSEDKVFRGSRTIQYELQDHSIYKSKEPGIIEYLTYRYPVPYLGAAVAYKLSTYKEFGTPKTYPDYEDQLMFFRAILHHGVHYFPEKLTQYRQHYKNYTHSKCKETHIDDLSLLSCFLDKNLEIAEKYIDCLISHKTATQQWLDYIYAIDSNLTQANYQAIKIMWRNLETRHNFLSQNTKNERRPKLTDYINKITAILIGSNSTLEHVKRNLTNGFRVLETTQDEYNTNILEKTALEANTIIVASKKFFELKEKITKDNKIRKNKIIRLPAALFDKEHNTNE